jgi:putative phosphoribosyl transferase
MAEDTGHEAEIKVRAGEVLLAGDLCLPETVRGLVLFAHGSGSSRHSSRNRFVAKVLRNAGLGTLLFDLLTAEEERVDAVSAQLRFDIGLLAERVIGVTDWLKTNPETAHLRLGYFGASTGAAAALVAAAQRPEVAAVVSRGGRPDLAGDYLTRVQAPTLLIVGGDDVPVIALNQQAYGRLGTSDKQLVIVPGASHLFEEPGTLEQVAQLAADWFGRRPGTARD